MPQMSPLYWWILFMYFVIMLLLMCIMNYYITIYKPINMNEVKTFKKLFMIWKW
uniref:ATP synthase F0 subunit 8 n=1 Tax=Nemoptera sinuata TaxID=1593329 RepID=UPI0030029F1E|nr:ATP synthase F0 subunit 8 [Nemoptera sinuata]